MNGVSTVCIVDADPTARRSMAEIARSKGLEVREYEAAEHAFGELPSANGCTCLIADVVQDGPVVELLRRMCDAGKSTPVVVVGPDDTRTAVRAMQQGAITYLPKPWDPQELSAAIDAALERASEQRQAINQKEELRQRFEQLTASEREVLGRVMEGQPNRQIANEMDIGLRTVELRRSNIMRKTGASNLLELTRLTIDVNLPNALKTRAAKEEAAPSEEPAA